jgi:glutathionylspermidine synthase
VRKHGTSGPLFLNAGTHCHSTLIPVVTAAVSESEYAGVFANGQIAVDEIRALGSLGYRYPQPPPVILGDSECAVGLATDTVRAKKSKSIDMDS